MALYFFCGRCSPLGKSWPHHSGKINSYIKCSKPLCKKSIASCLDKFNDDIEHGTFHGLMTAFCAYLISSSSDRRNFEKIFSSCLLHDFIKSIEGNNAYYHDQRLKEYFPSLLNETYGHKVLADQYSNSYLILADRLELMRFSDHRDWADDRLTLALNSLSPANKKTVEFFYKKLRPALEIFYQNRNSIWISHGIERVQDNFTAESAFPCPNSCHIP